jgi:hypothetical protein
VETSKIVYTETMRDADWNEDVSYVVDSLAERISRGLKLPGRIRSAPPAEGAAAPGTPAPSSVAPPATRTASTSASLGFIKIGRALRLGAAKASDEAQVSTLLREAAQDTPSLARDVEDILRRWGRAP